MSLNYSFVTPCNPPNGHYYTCSLPSSPLTYSSLLETLQKDGVPTDRIQAVKCRCEENSPWTSFPPTFAALKPAISLQIFLKPCADPGLVQRVSTLEGENRELRAQISDLAVQFASLFAKSSPQETTPGTDDMSTMQRSISLMATVGLQREISRSGNEMDMAYFYAMPLVSLVEKRSFKGKVVALGDPIDAHGEISAIQSELAKQNRRVRLAVNIGSIENIMAALGQKPKIVHISCHGQADVIQSEEDSKSNLYLSLEDKKLNGELCKCTVDELKSYFKPRPDSTGSLRPRLVFISACYSEEFADIIHQAGVPNVVGINGHTQIADEAAIEFAKIFYGLLVEGETVKEAFDNAKNRVAPTSKKIRMCCCTHQHKKDCKWLEKYWNKASLDEGHSLHVPDCNCPGVYPICNQHARSCGWVKKINKLLYGEASLPLYEGDKWCCCSPELAHSEREKFKLWSGKPGDENERLFEGAGEGRPEFITSLSDQDVPVVKDKLFGKNKELYKLINYLSPKDIHKVIFVVGRAKSERSLLIKTAARYVLERGGIFDTQKFGFVMIKLINTLCILSILHSELFPGQPTNSRQIDIAELRRRLRPLRKIVGLRCGDMSEASLAELIEILKKISQDAPDIKFVVIRKIRANEKSEDEFDNDYKNIVIPKVVMPDLDGHAAYNLIKSRYPKLESYMHLVSGYSFLDKLKTHRNAKRVVDLLQLGASLTKIESMFNKESTDLSSFFRSNAVTASIVSTQNALEAACGNLLPFLLLCQMDSGVFESFFRDFCADAIRDDYKKRFDEFIVSRGCKFSCESSWKWWVAFLKGKRMIRKKKVENMEECRYKVWKGMREHVRDQCQKQVLAQYKCSCIGKLASILRQLIQSYNLNDYRRLRHDEFSALVNDGIWICSRKRGSGDSERRIKDPLEHFKYEFRNIKALLDTETLNSIVEHHAKLEDFLDDVRELTVCTFSLLIHMKQQVSDKEKFFELAYEFANIIQAFAEKKQLGVDYARTFEIREKYTEMTAAIKLLKGGMDLDSSRDSASEAYSLFQSIDHKAGVAEALYMLALLDSRLPAKRDLALSQFDSARKHFQKSNCEVGVARASLAEAIFYMEISETPGNVVEELLAGALKITGKYGWLKNLDAECLYQRAKFRERKGLHEAAIKDLKEALANFQEVGNTKTADECASMRNRITSSMQQDKPLLVLLKASPLVDIVRNEIQDIQRCMLLEPMARDQTAFQERVYDMARQEHKNVKLHFDVLTHDNLLDVFLKSCSLLVLSSDHYGTDVMSFEGETGNLDCIKLSDLKAALENIVYNSQCKVIVLTIPDSKAIAEMFIELGVPHVIYFSFPATFYEYGRIFDIHQIQYELMDTFALHFCQKLIQGRALTTAMEDANISCAGFAEKCAKRFGIKDFAADIRLVPILAGKKGEAESEAVPHEVILPSLRRCEILEETSPVRTVPPEERPRNRGKFVGRQEELYRIAMELRNNMCVNLFGKPGVGKTRLAEEVATFLKLHSIIPQTLFYRCETEADDKRLEDRMRAEVKDFRSGDSSRLLIIVDNQSNRQNWTATAEGLSTSSNSENVKQSRASALANIMKSYKCVFLVISLDQLEAGGRLVFSPISKLGRLQDPSASFSFVYSSLEASFSAGKSPPIEKILSLEQHNLEEIRRKVNEAKGFVKQKSGNPIGLPRELEMFCEALIRRCREKRLLVGSARMSSPNVKKGKKFAPMIKSQSANNDDYTSGKSKVKRKNTDENLDLSQDANNEDKEESLGCEEEEEEDHVDIEKAQQSDSEESFSEKENAGSPQESETEEEEEVLSEISKVEGKPFEKETLKILRVYAPRERNAEENELAEGWEDEEIEETDFRKPRIVKKNKRKYEGKK